MKNNQIRAICRAGRTALLLRVFLLLGSGLLWVASTGCSTERGKEVEQKMIILGFDGMDPNILTRLVQEGKLPTFARLMREGDFRPLATTMPPQSPVAWSTVITGMNPGGHGIFDFIHRNPENLLPHFSISSTKPGDRLLTLGDWIIPKSRGEVTLMRRGTAFWEILDQEGIPVMIFRIPVNFPPVECDCTQLSGMGTPDLLGSYGTFSFYTEERMDREKEISGGRVFPVKNSDNRIRAQIPGPRNSFREGSPSTSVEMDIWVDPENPVAEITVQNQQILLQEGEWSDWMELNFELIPFLESARGMCRFFLKEVRPHFKLYLSPVNINPSSPVMPISSPESFSEDLSREIGLFYTQGIPEDTDALSGGVLSEEEFLRQSRIVFEEELRMLDFALERFQSGLLFFYIGRVDQIGHLFWHSTQLDEIEQAYREMDQVLATTLGKVDEQTTLMVLSDHGFAPFDRSFGLNSWLKREGYISVHQHLPEGLLRNVDWRGTRAYGLGFNGLYLNLAGREKRGTVLPGVEQKALLDEITEKLLALQDPETGHRVVTSVYRTEQIYRGPYLDQAPDLIIGYNRGYRASSESVLGSFSEAVLKENTDQWRGDHLIDAQHVPGILLSNRKIRERSPTLRDVAPTILSEFQISRPDFMTGNNLFR